MNLVCEILKVLFNITVSSDYDACLGNEEERDYLELVTLLRSLLLISVQDDSKKLELHSNVVNLLTNIPGVCYKELITDCESEDVANHIRYEKQNMKSIHELINFLKIQLTSKLVSLCIYFSAPPHTNQTNISLIPSF